MIKIFKEASKKLKFLIQPRALKQLDLQSMLRNVNISFENISKNNSSVPTSIIIPNGINNNESIIKAAQILQENGIVVIKNYFNNQKKLNSISAKAKEYIQESIRMKQERAQVKDRILPCEKQRYSYSEMAKATLPTLSIRKERDDGMVDVFGVDKSSEKFAIDLRKIMDIEEVKKVIMLAYERKLTSANLNIYYNKGVTKTRNFHVDSYHPSIKSFLYLSDVELSNGPYSYVLGSHLDAWTNNHNKNIIKLFDHKPSTDCLLFDMSQSYPITGMAGTLIISDQSGIHRGFPQDDNKERIAGVLRYNLSQ